MDRNTFDSLSSQDQINYINNQLLQGHTITNICKIIGIGRTTIRDRFKKVGYEYNQKTKIYESIVEIISTENIKKQDSSNKVVVADADNHLGLKNILSNFNEMDIKLNEVYSWYKSQSSSKVVEADKLKINDFKGDTVTRSYKIYEDVQKDFVAFCEVNKKYKVQDIVSQALFEFIEKYK
ncbi:hypothetical protein [Clostridioides difficile]|uniref:hypothetical protein n=1 Tax=Clostridioides difficile TaxID=1496 RepID=UPI0008264463|nr:hypothetical protein [Clostridioides difficile]MDB3201847.1 hypothetical protein [Clostridioides difficile]MDB3559932.1 hypothetical protein [Clostridioides difficile]MDB3597552.1 hypothetical protein [Clostridioides difficile]MDX5649749.1 hypothetical protein [Clostridioides difficile]MEC5403878.1 hypothetical protein [Clostridioides difficile]